MATATGVFEIPAYISHDDLDTNAHPHPDMNTFQKSRCC
jgi:hypothetical protein